MERMEAMMEAFLSSLPGMSHIASPRASAEPEDMGRDAADFQGMNWVGRSI